MSTVASHPSGQSAESLPHSTADDRFLRFLHFIYSNARSFFPEIGDPDILEHIPLIPLLYLPRMYAARAIKHAELNQVEHFIDSLLEEWRVFTGLSTVLLATIFSALQIPEMLDALPVRTVALLCLITAFIGLLHGITYTVGFWSVKRFITIDIAVGTGRATISIRSLWVLMAMPAVWLAWSSAFFFLSILLLAWWSGSTVSPSSPSAVIGAKVVETMICIFGLSCYATIVLKLGKYGGLGERVDDALLDQVERSVDGSPLPR